MDVFAVTPDWPLTRPRLARIRPSPPTRCAPIAAAENGAHRAHPDAATRTRSPESITFLDAPLRPTAPIREPPNQTAAPKSCRDRTRV